MDDLETSMVMRFDSSTTIVGPTEFQDSSFNAISGTKTEEDIDFKGWYFSSLEEPDLSLYSSVWDCWNPAESFKSILPTSTVPQDMDSTCDNDNQKLEGNHSSSTSDLSIASPAREIKSEEPFVKEDSSNGHMILTLLKSSTSNSTHDEPCQSVCDKSLEPQESNTVDLLTHSELLLKAFQSSTLSEIHRLKKILEDQDATSLERTSWSNLRSEDESDSETQNKKRRINPSRICEYKDCNTTRHYGHVGMHARFCSFHKEPGMINLSRKLCKECSKSACYGPPDTRKKLYCAEHKRHGTVNLTLRRCTFPNCGKTANYGHLGEITQYCSKHKTDEMKLRKVWMKTRGVQVC